MIKLERVNIVFNKRTIISDGELIIERGKVTALTGPSGSGKTTLLYCLGLISSQKNYDYWFDGKKLLLNNDKEKAVYRKHKVGYIFQDNNLIDTMTVEDNLFTSLSFAGGELNAKGVEGKLQDFLRLIALSSKRKHYPRQLSGGERQRVAIACALIKNPDLIIADEPTSALDKKNANLVFSLLQKIAWEQNKMVVIATHDASIYSCADRVYSINEKKISLCSNFINAEKKGTFDGVHLLSHFGWRFYFRYIRNNAKKIVMRKWLMIVLCAVAVSFVSLCADFGENFVSEQETLMNRISNREIYVVNATSALPGYIKKFTPENRSFSGDQLKEISNLLGVDEVIPYFELQGNRINEKELNFLVVPYHEDQLMDTKSIRLDESVDENKAAYLSFSLAQKLKAINLDSFMLDIDFSVPTKIKKEVIEKIEREETITTSGTISVSVRGVLDGQLANTYSENPESNILYLPHAILSEILKENKVTVFEQNEIEWMPSACWVLTYSYSDILSVRRALVDTSTNYQVFYQYQDFESMIDSIQQTRTIMTIVSIAIFVIICLLMTVICIHEIERRKYEVCILKANGMTRAEVYRLVLLESLYEALKIFVFAALFTCLLAVFVNNILFQHLLIPLNLKLFLMLLGMSVLTIVPPSIATLIFSNRYEPDKLLRG